MARSRSSPVEMGVTVDAGLAPDFDGFVRSSESALRRAVACHVPVARVDDAVAEALAYAYEHWDRLREMEFPVAYLVRVSRSRTRERRQGFLPQAPSTVDDTVVEPALTSGMHALPDRQRTALWLVHGCGWSYAEAASALGISKSAVGSHVERGLRTLRRQLGVKP